ncbi:MBOAT family O-acyltransferase [Persephonella sp. KM09-Lau-8]|uniref:MBOAT family O-acyltransferase n=1 Tax=Persephonella sp. KM09-Lau-8 TaxID=1158345 RepID=UPI00068E9264|nr:MBOAT family O-acyltransferase [Persephonella sp. KM09-Lau-8]
MQELITGCIDHLRIGNVLFFLLLPLLFLLSYFSSRLSITGYKLFQVFIGFIYYLLILKGNLPALFVFLNLIAVNYLLLRNMDLFDNKPSVRRAILIVAIVINLIPLIMMKDYLPLLKTEPNYFIQIVGLSYFSLNVISMFVDFYKRKFRKFFLIDFLLYSIYFPKIFAGPLVRYREFIRQVNWNYRNKTFNDLNLGVFLLALGIIKKWFADYLFQYSSAVFSNPAGFSGEELFMNIYVYTAYIFLDFSGYTDLARGTSLLMGINLPENFRSPYLSKSFREFWRRWHITLYQWIRDYVYIDLLGGNRKGKIRTYINILIAFILSGIWHGNYFNYIIWGFSHGLGVIFTRDLKEDSKIKRYLMWFLTFNLIAVLWIVFAITDISTLKDYFVTMVTGFNPAGLASFVVFRTDIVIPLILGFGIAFIDSWLKEKFVVNLPPYRFYAVSSILFLIAIFLLNYKVAVSPFLYESF